MTCREALTAMGRARVDMCVVAGLRPDLDVLFPSCSSYRHPSDAIKVMFNPALENPRPHYVYVRMHNRW